MCWCVNILECIIFDYRRKNIIYKKGPVAIQTLSVLQMHRTYAILEYNIIYNVEPR